MTEDLRRELESVKEALLDSKLDLVRSDINRGLDGIRAEVAGLRSERAADAERMDKLERRVAKVETSAQHSAWRLRLLFTAMTLGGGTIGAGLTKLLSAAG